MRACIDSSVLIAAVVHAEEHHAECDSLLDQGNAAIYLHGLTETFSTLTGGRLSFRMPAAMAAELIDADYIPFLEITTLTPTQTLRAMRECENRGVRGGAIFDYLHLVAARKAKADRFYTLNISNFRAFHRTGDPEIVHP